MLVCSFHFPGRRHPSNVILGLISRLEDRVSYLLLSMFTSFCTCHRVRLRSAVKGLLRASCSKKDAWQLGG